LQRGFADIVFVRLKWELYGFGHVGLLLSELSIR